MRAKKQREAFDLYDCDGAGCAVISRGEGHSGRGYYVHCSEYPDEGSIYLGARPCVALKRRSTQR
jgi:hypothetical protein